MPLWYLDADGNYLGENSTPYPAPPEVVERLRANLPPDVARIEDVPPLTGEWWRWPPGASGPEPKPAIGASIDTEEVATGEQHHVLLSGVPEGASVAILGPYQGGFVSDGTAIELSFSEPGSYEIRVTSAGYRAERFVVTAVEPDAKAKKPAGKARAADAQQVLVGKTAETHAAEAVADVDAHFDQLAAPLAGAVAMLGEASAELAGKRSERIKRLAAAQGVSPEALAQSIKSDADRFWEHQEARARAKRGLADLAASGAGRAEMAALVSKLGVTPRPTGGEPMNLARRPG